MIVRCFDAPETVGMIVSILRAAGSFESAPDTGTPFGPHPNDGHQYWVIESAGADFKYGAASSRFAVYSDDLLRPLRDPGDDAQDEMLRPL